MQTEKTIIERTSSISDVFEIAGKTLADLSNPNDTPDEVANKVIKLVAKVLNPPDWKADYSNRSQKKYFPIFVWDDAAGCFRFYFTHYGYTHAGTSTGVRHVFESEELSDHAAEIAIHYYNEMLK